MAAGNGSQRSDWIEVENGFNAGQSGHFTSLRSRLPISTLRLPLKSFIPIKVVVYRGRAFTP